MDMLDSPMYKRSRMAASFVQIVGLSILWLLCCLPIVSFGPATMAAYHISVKVIRRGRGKLLSTFFQTFRSSWKQGAVVGSGVVLLAAVLVFCVRFASVMAVDNRLWRILTYIYFLLLILLGIFSTFLFPIFSRFRMPVLAGLKVSCVLTLRHFFTALTCFLVYFLGAKIVLWLPAMLLVIPAVCFLICSLVIEPILKRYTTPGQDPDRWYLE